LREEESSDIRTEMTVTTLSNSPAKVQGVAEEVLGASIVWYGHDKLILAPVTMTAGDVLEVLPRVNSDGTILVKLAPSKSAFEEGQTMSAQGVITEVVINDGDTIVISGLEEGTGRSAGQRTSFLGIPLSSGRQRAANSVVMFLTARVMD
jgi:type II secretory pathway component GspD/PulD (secretin)